jgi:hypothetical protein
MSVAQVGQMSAAELDMWMVRASFEPFTAKRIEIGLAQIAMWIYNANSKKPKGLQDFLLFKGADPAHAKPGGGPEFSAAGFQYQTPVNR